MSDKYKTLFEECGKGLAQLILLAEVESRPRVAQISQKVCDEGVSLGKSEPDTLQSSKELVRHLEVLMAVNKRTTFFTSGGISSTLLLEKLTRLNRGQELINSLLTEKSLKLGETEEKKSQIQEIERLICSLQTQVTLTNTILVNDANLIEKEGQKVVTLKNECQTLEQQKHALSKELSTLMGTEQIQSLRDELKAKQSRVLETHQTLTATKRSLETLEAQLSSKKWVLDSNLKQQETIKKLNYDLEEKIMTARKGNTASKFLTSHKKGTIPVVDNLPAFSLLQLDQSSYMTPTKGNQCFLAASMPVLPSRPFTTGEDLSPTQLLAQMEQAFVVSQLSREAQTTEQQGAQMQAEVRFQEEKNREAEYKLKLLEIDLQTKHSGVPLLGKRSLALLEEEDELTVKAELQFTKWQLAQSTTLQTWRQAQADASVRLGRELQTRRLTLLQTHLVPLQTALGEVLLAERADGLIGGLQAEECVSPSKRPLRALAAIGGLDN